MCFIFIKSSVARDSFIENWNLKISDTTIVRNNLKQNCEELAFVECAAQGKALPNFDNCYIYKPNIKKIFGCESSVFLFCIKQFLSFLNESIRISFKLLFSASYYFY